MLNQLFLNGIIAVSIYALIAIGFTVIYRTVKFFHFAHVRDDREGKSGGTYITKVGMTETRFAGKGENIPGGISEFTNQI